MRIYGRDLIKRFESAAFIANLEDFSRRLPRGQVELNRHHDGSIVVCVAGIEGVVSSLASGYNRYRDHKEPDVP